MYAYTYKELVEHALLTSFVHASKLVVADFVVVFSQLIRRHILHLLLFLLDDGKRGHLHALTHVLDVVRGRLHYGVVAPFVHL